MNFALSRPSPLRRGGLLAAVVGFHAGVLLLILAARTVAPQILEMPLVVDILTPPQPEVKPAPLPVAAPTPRPRPAPRAPAPVLEPTASSVPAEAAPVAASHEPPPAPAPVAAPAPEPVSQPRFDADYLRNPAPPYPALSRRLGEEGKVLLRVLVSPQGQAETVELKASSGSLRLDEAAIATVRGWRFVPARRGDAPVQSWVVVPILFKLER